MNVQYLYSERDLLKQSQKYEKTPYQGSNFLVAYTKSREKILNVLQNNIIPLNEVVKRLSLNINFNILTDIKKGFQANELFIKIAENLVKESAIEIFDFIIDKFVRKFEVEKKIFASYDNEFKKTTEDYSNLQNYVLLSLICIYKYKYSKKLRYLNVVLKLNDLICSQIEKINGSINSSLLNFVLRDELLAISSLLDAKRIEIKK